MLQKEVNISSFKKKLPEFLELVLKGDEIILTKSNVPIAKISPIEDPSFKIKKSYYTPKVINNKRATENVAPEYWFG